MSPLYFDHNATTPIDARVAEAMTPYLSKGWGNPSSQHVFGRDAKRALDKAREQVARLIGATPSEVIFTSGGSESNNHIILGSLSAPETQAAVTSSIEHPAVIEPLLLLERKGLLLSQAGVDSEGAMALEVFDHLAANTKLVTVMLANNETGVVHDLAEISRRAKACVKDVVVHTDAAQAVGKIQVNVDALGVDALTIAGHKLYAPKGIGVLYLRQGTVVEKLIHGAGHEGGRRAGTENVLLAVGLGEAAEICEKALNEESKRQRRLRDTLFALLKQGVGEDKVRCSGESQERLPNTLNVSFYDTDGNALLARAPELAASVGSACHEGQETLSPVLSAMNVPRKWARGAVRLSLGRHTSKEDVESAAAMLVEAYLSL